MESPCEMGVYCIEGNQRYNSPFVWNNVKITSLEVDNNRKGYERDAVFKIDTVIYPIGYKGEKKKHTFFCKNGLFFFLDSILKTINTLIEKGYPIDRINFDFLDNQCEGWNFLAANHQLHPHFELPFECNPIGFFRLINEMNIDVYQYRRGNRNGGWEWNEVEMTIQTIDEYVNSIVSEFLKTAPSVNTETNTTMFCFKTEERSDDCAYGGYEKVPIEPKKKEGIKKDLIEKICVNCLKKIDRASAILYHSLKHN